MWEMIFLYRLRHLKPLPLSHALISLVHAGVIDNEDLEERLWMNWNDCLVQKIEGAYAPSTIRAYKSNFESFIKFCNENNTSALPATNEIVAIYIKKLSNHLRS